MNSFKRKGCNKLPNIPQIELYNITFASLLSSQIILSRRPRIKHSRYMVLLYPKLFSTTCRILFGNRLLLFKKATAVFRKPAVSSLNTAHINFQT